MASVYVLCPGCETRYDVARRAPGRRLRCPRCEGVLVVPEAAAGPSSGPSAGPASEGTAAPTTSERLRRARGPTCRAHPRTLAEGRCTACRRPLCARCFAAPPIDDYCAECARARDLGPAVAVDFGLVATPLLAARALAKSLPRVLAWNLLALVASALLLAVPVGAAYAFQAEMQAGGASWRSDAWAAVFLGSALGVYVLYYLVVVPAGCSVLVDQAIRGGGPGFAGALRATVARVTRHAGDLFVIIVCLVVAYAPWFVLVSGGAMLLHGGGAPDLALALALVGLPLGLLPLAVAFGLGAPVVVLEGRPALQALARAWELARPHLPGMVGLVAGYFLLYGVVAAGLAALAQVSGLPLVTAALAHLLDLLWPALLVAAYHGLAAEHAAVPGRH